MFNKLLSNLPFNPSLITQVAFYGKRLKREASIRRLGFVFMGLAMSVQMFAIIAPPKSSMAASTNDIIYGGLDDVHPRNSWLNAYNNGDSYGHKDIKAIYDHYGIGPAQVPSVITTVNSNDTTLYSLGRHTGPAPYANLDEPVDIGGTTLYLRPLWVWGKGVNYRVLEGTRTSHDADETSYFAAMMDCGNIIVKKGSTPKPKLSAPVKTNLNGTGLPADDATVSRGQNIAYRVSFSNNGPGVATNVQLVDHIPPYTTYATHGSGGASNGGQHTGSQVTWTWNQMPGSAQNWYVDLWVKVDSNAPSGTKICNTADLSSGETSLTTSQPPVCHVVVVPSSPTPSPTPTPTPTPTPSPTPSPAPSPTPSTPTPTPTPPPTPVAVPGQPNITRTKLVSNLTQGVNNANGTTAKAGDVLNYQVLTINNGTATSHKFDGIKDEVGDLLEYADILEISDGGTLKDNLITWKPVDIKADSKLTYFFKAQVKNPIPSTLRSSSNPASYDLQIDNTYGNTVTVKLPAPTVAKAAEIVTTSSKLQNTGPGTTLIIGFSLTAIVGYFFARSRLLATELELVKVEQTSGSI